MRALERLREVCTGELVLVDSIDLTLTFLLPRRPVATLDARERPWWWTANVAGIVRMLEAARFKVAIKPRRIFMPAGRGQPLPPPSLRGLLTAGGRDAELKRRKGDPHVVIRALPT